MGTPVERALEPRYYNDRPLFEKEKENIFFKTWQYACHVGEIEKPGDYLVFEIAHESLFVIRDKENNLRAFYNVCQHRAHQLLQASGNRSSIICPYHAWSYRLDGQLQAAPNSKNVLGFDSTQICLPEVRLEVFCGFVFVNLDDNAKSMKDWYGKAEDDLRRYVREIDDYKPMWTHHSDQDCNWKVAVENYNECYHCKVVHPSFVKGVIAADSVNIFPDAYTLRHTAHSVRQENGAYEFEDNDYRVIFLWPTMAIQIYPGRVVNTYWWRVKDIHKTQTFRGWLTLGGVDDPQTRKIAEMDRDTTFAEDLPLVNSVQRGLQSRGYRPGPLVIDPAGGVANELSVLALQRWVREALD